MGSQRLKITPKRSATITVRLSTPHEPVYIYIFFCILVPSLSLVCFVSVISHACYMLCQCERVGRQTRLRVDPHILNFVPSYLIFCLCVYAPSCSLTPSFLFLRASHNVQNQEFFFCPSLFLVSSFFVPRYIFLSLSTCMSSHWCHFFCVTGVS